MEITLSYGQIAALFGTMLILAFVPGVSVLIVSSRAAGMGFMHGVSATAGIVAGDIIFIVLAIYGLALLSELMGSGFGYIKLLGGAYLIWLGTSFLRKATSPTELKNAADSSLTASFLSGFLITLSDQKAILFYLGFFPAFVDLSRLSALDTAIVIATAALSICLAKLSYALMAARAGARFENPVARGRINLTAGLVLMAVGVILLLRI